MKNVDAPNAAMPKTFHSSAQFECQFSTSMAENQVTLTAIKLSMILKRKQATIKSVYVLWFKTVSSIISIAFNCLVWRKQKQSRKKALPSLCHNIHKHKLKHKCAYIYKQQEQQAQFVISKQN